MNNFKRLANHVIIIIQNFGLSSSIDIKKYSWHKKIRLVYQLYMLIFVGIHQIWGMIHDLSDQVVFRRKSLKVQLIEPSIDLIKLYAGTDRGRLPHIRRIFVWAKHKRAWDFVYVTWSEILKSVHAKILKVLRDMCEKKNIHVLEWTEVPWVVQFIYQSDP